MPINTVIKRQWEVFCNTHCSHSSSGQMIAKNYPSQLFVSRYPTLILKLLTRGCVGLRLECKSKIAPGSPPSYSHPAASKVCKATGYPTQSCTYELSVFTFNAALAAGFRSTSIIQSRFVFVFQPHQQGLRGNEEDLGHDVLVIEALIEFCHVVLRCHLPLHVF